MSEARTRYSRVTRRMWNDAKFRALSAPPPNAQTLWLRLLTGPELTSVPGLFSAWEGGLANALGWDLKGFREAFGEAFRQGMVKADWSAGLVWVPNAIEHNHPESPNVIRSWRIVIDELPECDLKREALEHLRAFAKGLPEAFAKAFDEICPPPSPNQEQEQEQERDKEDRVSQVRRVAAPVEPEPTGPSTPTLALLPPEASKPRAPELEVFEHYVAGWHRVIRGSRPPIFDAKRRGTIRARLAQGFDVESLKRACDGLWADEWHVKNHQTSIDLVCRDAEHVEKFMAKAPPPPEVYVPGAPLVDVSSLPSPTPEAEAEFDAMVDRLRTGGAR